MRKPVQTYPNVQIFGYFSTLEPLFCVGHAVHHQKNHDDTSLQSWVLVMELRHVFVLRSIQLCKHKNLCNKIFGNLFWLTTVVDITVSRHVQKQSQYSKVLFHQTNRTDSILFLLKHESLIFNRGKLLLVKRRIQTFCIL